MQASNNEESKICTKSNQDCADRITFEAVISLSRLSIKSTSLLVEDNGRASARAILLSMFLRHICKIDRAFCCQRRLLFLL